MHNTQTLCNHLTLSLSPALHHPPSTLTAPRIVPSPLEATSVAMRIGDFPALNSEETREKQL